MFTGNIAEDMEADVAAQVEDLHRRYMDAWATVESASSSDAEVFEAQSQMAELKGEAESLAYSAYMQSEGVDIATQANVALAEGIAAGTGDAYENAGLTVAEKLTQGITRHINSYTPPPIKVPVVTRACLKNKSCTKGADMRN